MFIRQDWRNRYLPWLFMVLLFLAGYQPAESQGIEDSGNYVDMGPLRPATELLCRVMDGQIVQTTQTYASHSNYRADWEQPTAVQLSNGCYFWYGDLRITTIQPVILSGCRGPAISLLTQTKGGRALMDSDGGIPDWDRDCWSQGPYWPRFSTRPEASFMRLMDENAGFRRVWQLVLQKSEIDKFDLDIQEIFEYMGLDENGNIPRAYVPQVNEETAIEMALTGESGEITLNSVPAILGLFLALGIIVRMAVHRQRSRQQERAYEQ